MKLDGLQVGRAVAALMVVAFHANGFTLPDRFYDGERAARLFEFGYAGVEFFFVLSGFIMALVHRADFSQPDRAGLFMAKRIVRVYPLYVLIYLALTAAYFAAPGFGPDHARDPVAIATSVVLWPMPYQPVMQVAWTLQHEMLFYLVFTLLVLRFRIGAGVFALWMAGCLIAAPFGEPPYPWGFILSPYNILFLLGVAAAESYRSLSEARARATLAAGAAFFCAIGLSEAYGFLDWNFALRTVAYGLGATLAVAGLAAGAIRAPRSLVFLGDASYAIYLAHLPAFGFFAVVATRLGAPWGLSPLAMLCITCAVGVAAGAAAHVFVERPLLAWLKPGRRKAAA